MTETGAPNFNLPANNSELLTELDDMPEVLINGEKKKVAWYVPHAFLLIGKRCLRRPSWHTGYLGACR